MRPMIRMYKSMASDSKVEASIRMRIPRPAWAPVDSAASRVVRPAPRPSRTAVMMNGTVAGRVMRKKMSTSLAPRTFAAFTRVLSMLRMPPKMVTVMVIKVQIQIRIMAGVRPTPAAITIRGA